MELFSPPTTTVFASEILEALKRPAVLVRDQHNLWCALSELYWSTSTRQLLSRHPQSTLQEVISLYCPQCLTRYTEDDVIAFSGSCPKCKECPCCSSIVVIKNKDIYCSFCLWQKSTETAALKTTAQEERDRLAQDSMKALIESMREKHKNPHEGHLMKNAHLGEWHLEQLRLKLKEHTIDYFASEERVIQSGGRGIPNDDEIACQSMEDTLITNVVQRFGNMQLQPCLMENLLPSRVALRSKRTIRNRAEAEAGKPGILIQPKTLPLEGDSSSKVQRGKWWGKDSSAIHHIPFIALSELPDRERMQDGSYSYISVSFSNPQSIEVVLTFDREQQNRAPLSYIIVDELGKSSVVRTKGLLHTSSALHKSGSVDYDDPNKLCLLLGPYEEELLKETGGVEECPQPPMPGSPRAGKAAKFEDVPSWESSVSYNKGRLRIPVCFAKASDGTVINEYHADYLTCAIEVQLHCIMQVEGEKDIPIMIKLIL